MYEGNFYLSHIYWDILNLCESLNVSLPGGVVVALRTLTPSTQVRILAGQPWINVFLRCDTSYVSHVGFRALAQDPILS